MCNCCNRILQATAESVTVASGVVTITMPADFVPVEGCLYDISLATSLPYGTNGAEILIGTAPLLNRLGSNVRMSELNAQWVLRVMYLGDPDHYNLISRKWRAV